MEDLAACQCVPCRGGVPALTGDQIAPLIAQLKDWVVIDEHHLSKMYKFGDFREALEWVNKVGALAHLRNRRGTIRPSQFREGILCSAGNRNSIP